MTLDAYLEDLERRIDPAEEDRIYAQWVDFLDGRFDGDIFSPHRTKESPPSLDWPTVRINAALNDFDQMTLQQFALVSKILEEGGGAMLDVRANYGSSILPSLFGVEMFFMDDALNVLPTSRPLAGGKDAIRAAIDCGVPNLDAGQGAKVFETGRRFMAVKQRYPKIGRCVQVYHPDIQGPMDVCELLWGSSIFYDLVDEPDLVHSLLELITETYTQFLRKWQSIVPVMGKYTTHWGSLQKGVIALRDDSAMNLSPAMFDEFIRPYDSELLKRFGGGTVHFCGRGDHYIDMACAMEGMTAIFMSQPDYNDMEVIYRATVDRGIPLLQFSRQWAEEALEAGRDLHGMVHCR